MLIGCNVIPLRGIGTGEIPPFIYECNCWPLKPVCTSVGIRHPIGKRPEIWDNGVRNSQGTSVLIYLTMHLHRTKIHQVYRTGREKEIGRKKAEREGAGGEGGRV
jgi:hypothetical protein